MIANNAAVDAPRGFGDILGGVRRGGSEAARRADELDRLGGIPQDLFDELSATGCFRSMVPTALGGLEFSLSEINELIIEAAKANGSYG